MLPTSMADVQSHYQAIPYGWREIDIAAVAARLISEQKVTIKYAGATVQTNSPRLPELLRKKSETGKTLISKRQIVSALQMRQAKEFLREYLDVMDVPDDEDGLIAFVIDRLGKQKKHYEDLNRRYDGGKKYPDRPLLLNMISLIENVLSQQKDSIALISRLNQKADALLDSKEALQRVENFFQNQVSLFDSAVRMEENLRHELDYLSTEPEANDALNQIRLICLSGTNGKFAYTRIPELNGLIVWVKEGHDRLLARKREEMLEYVRQCMEAIHTAAGENSQACGISAVADQFYTQKKEKIGELESLALLDGLLPPMLQYKDQTMDKIEAVIHPVPVTPPINPKPPVGGGTDPVSPLPQKKIYKNLNRSIVFPAKDLESEEDIDKYIEKMRQSLKQLLKNCDGIRLK